MSGEDPEAAVGEPERLEADAHELMEMMYEGGNAVSPSAALTSKVFEMCMRALILQMQANRIQLKADTQRLIDALTNRL